MLPDPAWAPAYHTPMLSDRSDGPQIAAFSERFLRVTRGMHAGKPLALLPWQEWLLGHMTERDPDTGLWRYRQYLLSVCRKAGKSLLSANLVLYYLLVDPEPGREIYSVANDRQQAALVFNEVRDQVLSNPALSKHLEVLQYSIRHPASNSSYKIMSSDYRLAHGTNPSIVIFDEVWGQKSDDLWQAFATGSGARAESLLIGVSTPGDMAHDALFTRLWDYGRKAAGGDVDDRRFGFTAFQAPDGCDHMDERNWHIANPNLAAGMADMDEMRSAARQTPEAMFRRYRLGQPVRLGGMGWMDMAAWDAQGEWRAVPPGEEIVMAFDGSVTDDATALVAMTVKEPYLWVLGVWQRPDGAEDWQVPRHEVDAVIEDAFAMYKVRAFHVDTAYWLAEFRTWQERFGVRVVLDFTMSNARMVPAVQEFFSAIREGVVTHSGDRRLTAHVANAVAKETPRGVTIGKDSKSSPRKIDLAVAACMANDARLRIPARRAMAMGF